MQAYCICGRVRLESPQSDLSVTELCDNTNILLHTHIQPNTRTTRQLTWETQQRHQEFSSCFFLLFAIYCSSQTSLYIDLLVYRSGCPSVSLTTDVLLPFPPGAVFEEVYPGNSGQRSLPVWQVCDGGLTAAVLHSLSLSVFLSPVSPSFEPAAAESRSVLTSPLLPADLWSTKDLDLTLATYTHRHAHTPQQLHIPILSPPKSRLFACACVKHKVWIVHIALMLCARVKTWHWAVTYS